MGGWSTHRLGMPSSCRSGARLKHPRLPPRTLRRHGVAQMFVYSLPSRQGEASSSSDSLASLEEENRRDEIARGIIHVLATALSLDAVASAERLAPAFHPSHGLAPPSRPEGLPARPPDPLVVAPASAAVVGMGAEPRPRPPPLSKPPPPLPPDSWAEGPAPPVPLDVQRNTVVSDVVHLPGDSSAAAIPECAICLEAFAPGQQVRTLPCMHRFHMQCADHWLRRGIPLCPVCRNPVVM